MSSAGQIIGGVVGGAIGFFVGGPAGAFKGAMWGASIGGMIDPPKGPALIGPRLSDLSQQGASYGLPVPRIYGSAAVYGNVFWIENNQLKETSHTESAGKGGGQEVTTYSYSATFALGLCEGPIAGIRRIWIMGNLIYDAQSTDVDTIAASNKVAQGFTLHLGGEDQLPDSRMQATLGVDNTPAFRGLAYIVFNDLALEKYGNSLMSTQIKVEVVQDGTYTDRELTTSVADTGVRFKDYYGAWLGRPHVLEENGELLVGIVGSSTQYLYSRGGLVLAKKSGLQNACEASKVEFGRTWWSPGKVDTASSVVDDDIWLVPEAYYNQIGSVIRRANSSMSRPLDVYMPPDRRLIGCLISNSRTSMIVIYSDVGALVGAASNNALWFEIDLFGEIKRSGKVIGAAANNAFGFGRSAVYNYTAGCYDDETGLIVTGMGAVTRSMTIRRINDANELVVVETLQLNYVGFSYPSIYTKNNIIYTFCSSAFGVYTSNLLTDTSPSLSEVVAAECVKSSVLSNADLDMSSLTDTVVGYRISSIGAIRAGLGPLQGAFPFDVMQAGYKIKAVRRGGSASVVTIPSALLGAGQKDADELITESREMDTQLPRRVRVQHLDPDREYNVGEQYAERLNTTSINETSIDLAVVLSYSSAAKIAETLLYLYWLERSDFSFTLPPAYRYLEPADVVTVQTADANYVFRLTTVHYQSDGVISCTAKLHRPVYTSLAAGAAGGQSPSIIQAVGMTSLALIDTACVIDSLDQPGFIVAAAGYSPGWPGSALYASTDAGVSYSQVGTFTRRATIGYVAVVIGEPEDSRMIDKGSVMVARFYGGATVSSVTEAQMLNGANHFVYGADGRWEIIAAQNAVLQPDGSYVLTDLLRGRFGTEWAMSSHVAMDSLVLLDRTTIQHGVSSLDSIGLERLYKPVTFGSSIDSTARQSFTYRGANLECLSPVYLNGHRDASGDWSLEWLRRTRIGREWRDYIDAPLGESIESYDVEIYTNGAYGAVKRTFSSLAIPMVSYTNAQQVADFGVGQSTLYVKVYQLSADVGRGYPLITSITR